MSESHHHHDHPIEDAPQRAGATDGARVIDPVCGMTVDPAKTAHHAEHQGDAFHFCSGGCRAKFVADPERYLKPAEAPPRPKVRDGAI